MTLAITIWFVSLAMMVLLALVGGKRTTMGTDIMLHQGFGDFVRETIVLSIEKLRHVAVRIEPHTSGAGRFVGEHATRFHDYLSDRVFGKVGKEKGRASSFFLKHIAEYKELIKKDGEKNGY